MNFKGFNAGSSRSEPVVNMNTLARQISKDYPNGANGPLAYAPPAVRDRQEEPVADQVKSFGELPTTELDEIVAAAEAEVAALKADAQTIRDLYVKHTSRVARDIDRLREGIKISMTTLQTLREQVVALDGEKIIDHKIDVDINTKDPGE